MKIEMNSYIFGSECLHATSPKRSFKRNVVQMEIWYICTQSSMGKLITSCKGLYTWSDLHTCANFAYMQNLHTYANRSMCTHLLTYAKFARMQKLENLHLPQTKCKSHFAYMQILHICKSGHVNAKQNLHT